VIGILGHEILQAHTQPRIGEPRVMLTKAVPPTKHCAHVAQEFDRECNLTDHHRRRNRKRVVKVIEKTNHKSAHSNAAHNGQLESVDDDRLVFI
jgi:hypothetical protein